MFNFPYSGSKSTRLIRHIESSTLSNLALNFSIVFWLNSCITSIPTARPFSEALFPPHKAINP